MNIFTLVGKITVNYADAVDNIDKVSKSASGAADSLGDVDKRADEAGDSVEDAGKSAKKADDGFTVWKATLANLATKAITGVISKCEELGAKLFDLTKNAVGNYAEYEQLVGGVETLFKDSADTLIGYAETAYKTAGMSSNEYMDTATSFAASLIQGLGGDTQKAVELTNLAITDMSDNANKMGTDMEAIQNAYQGFAKQNYTMLDNLKLGYGGTQSEMIRLINDSGVLNEKIESLDNVTFDQMIEAIHQIQDNLGITGTTALEAGTTIQGSWSSVQSLFENIITKVGSKLAPTVMNFLQQLSGWMESVDWDGFAEKVGNAFSGIMDWIQQIDFEAFFQRGIEEIEKFIENLQILMNIVPGIIEKFRPWLPLIEGIAVAFVTLGTALKITSLITGIVSAFQTLAPIISAAKVAFAALNATMLLNPFTLIAAAIAAVIAILVNLWNSNEDFRNAVIAIWESIKEAFSKLVEAISEKIEAIKNFFGNLKDNISEKVSQIKQGVSDKFSQMKQSMSTIMQAAKDTINEKLQNIKSAYQEHGGGIKGIAAAAIEAVKGYYTAGYSFIDKLTGGKLSAIAEKFRSKMSEARDFVKNAIDKIKSFFNFSWSLPHLKMPHFSISGSFSLNPPSVPSFGIDWYKKAMDDGMIMNQPTIFGYNPKSNQFMAGGEAGSETVVGTGNLMSMIKAAVGDENTTLIEKLDRILTILENFLPILPQLADMKVVMDSGALVGELAPGMDTALGKLADRDGRGG